MNCNLFMNLPRPCFCFLQEEIEQHKVEVARLKEASQSVSYMKHVFIDE